MKYVTIPFLVFGIAALGQTSAPSSSKPAESPAKAAPISPDTVVFKVGNRPVTAAEYERIISSFSEEIQQSARANPKQVMQSYFIMQNLGERATAEKLDQTSPYKEQLALQRMQLLAAAVVNRQSASIAVTPEEQQKRYEQDKLNKYEKAKIRAILIMYGDRMLQMQVDMKDPENPQGSPAKPMREEAEAKQIVEDLVEKLRAGADFAEIAKEKSEDKNSAANGGDFGVLRKGDRIPEEIKTEVFKLKPGEISDPIRQPLGYYIVKMEERSVQPFEEVQQAVEAEIRKERFDSWMDDIQKQFEVSIEKPEFFGQAPAK
jgi:peptidyl-prolyl cis-trans isomerase C